jgi:hypothetical protein
MSVCNTRTNDMFSEVRRIFWHCISSKSPSNGSIANNMGSDRVSSNRAVERPVRPFAVDFNHNNLSVLTTCKSFHDEVKPIFWSKATFVFRCTRDLNHFIKQRTIVPVPHALTNLENFQHVRLANDDLSNTRYVFRGRVIACLANGASIMSFVMQHGEECPCWCERCLDVHEVFYVEWEEQWAERRAEKERMEKLESRCQRRFIGRQGAITQCARSYRRSYEPNEQDSSY